MKKTLTLFSTVGFLVTACVQEPLKPIAPASVRHLECPAPNRLSSGITREKPSSAEMLVRQTLVPPGLTPGQEWNINGFASDSTNLYLSCFYSTRKILTYKLPLERELCMARDTDKHVSVECVKK